MQAITVTRFPNNYARIKAEFTVSLDQLMQRIMVRTASQKTELPLLTLSRFGDLKSPKGCLRWNRNMLSFSGIVGESDNGQMPFDEAYQRLRHWRLESVIYSTPSSTWRHPKWRIICPLYRDVDGDLQDLRREHERLMAYLNGAMDGVLAPESFNLSQAYYYGKVLNAPEPFYIETVHGRPIG